MKRLIGYRKRIVSLMCAIMFCAIGVFSTSFDSMANYYEFYTNYAEPSTSDSSGYITLLMRQTSTGNCYINTYFWNITGSVSGGSSANVYAYIDLSKDSLKFNIGGGTGAGGYYHLAMFDANGKIVEVKNSSTEVCTKTFSSGYECIGFKYSGNVGYFYRQPNFTDYVDFTVYFSSDSSAVLLSNIVDLLGSLSSDNSTILSRLYSIMNSVDGVESQLERVIDYLYGIELELDEVNTELDEIFYKAEDILNEQKKSNTWLEKIWNSIQEFINPSSNDSQKTDEYNSESNNQKTEINDLNEQNQSEKVDVDSASTQVDSNINYENMAEYGGVLATVTNNSYVLQMILIVVSIAIIAYVLFGKR